MNLRQYLQIGCIIWVTLCLSISFAGSFYLSETTTRGFIVAKRQTRYIDIDIQYEHEWQAYMGIYIDDTSNPYWNTVKHIHCDGLGTCFRVTPLSYYYSVRIQIGLTTYSCPVSKRNWYRLYENTWVRIINPKRPCRGLYNDID